MPSKLPSVLTIVCVIAFGVVSIPARVVHAEGFEGSDGDISNNEKTVNLVNKVSPAQTSKHNLSEGLILDTFDGEATAECAVCTLRHRRLLRNAKEYSE